MSAVRASNAAASRARGTPPRANSRRFRGAAAAAVTRADGDRRQRPPRRAWFRRRSAERPGPLPPAFARRAARLAPLLLLGPLLTLTPQAHAQTEPVWSTTMTVGETTVTGVGRGYDSYNNADLTNPGALDDDSFEAETTTDGTTTAGTNTVTARIVAVNHGDYSDRETVFVFSTGLFNAGQYTLEFAGEAFPLSDTTTTTTGMSAFRFSTTWVATNAPSLSTANYEATLPLGAKVQVCLRTAAQTCPPPPPPVWSTTLTVGEVSANSVGRGYDAIYNVSSPANEGALEVASFEAETTTDGTTTAGTNTVTATVIAANHAIWSSDTVFFFDTGLFNPDQYTVEFAGETFPLSEATTQDTNTRFRFSTTWVATNAPSLSTANYETTLPIGDKVTVCLRTATQTCAGTTPSVTTLVSNFSDVATNASVSVGESTSSIHKAGTQFTTGANANGYVLKSLTFRISALTASGVAPKVSIYTSVNDEPGAELYTFSDPSVSTGDKTVTAQANAALAASTSYFVVFEDSDTADGNWSASLTNTSTVYDTDSLTDWSLSGRIHSTDGGTIWTSVTSKIALKLTGEVASMRTNTPATGAPGITGTPQVGETLTATAGDMADDEGLPTTDFPTGYTFQWVLDDAGTETDISGATSQTYTPVAGDAGKTIKVEVTFEDGGGTDETLASDATQPVAGAKTACPTHNEWCREMTSGYSAGIIGSETFESIGYSSDISLGALEQPPTFSHDGTDYTVTQVNQARVSSGGVVQTNSVNFAAGAWLPDGTVLTLNGTTLTVGTDTESSTLGREQWDLTVLGIDFDWVTGTKVTTSLNFPPKLTTATVDGTSLVLTYHENLDTNSVPALAQFTVKKTPSGGTEEDVDLSGSPVVSGTQVTLTLDEAVVSTDGDVKVSYAVPASNPLQDLSGLDASAETDYPVTNNTGITPTNSAPVFTDGDSTTRGVHENEQVGTNFGRFVAATDADSDALTYSVDGTDAASFGIGPSTGWLRTKEVFDHETKSSYSITVKVVDTSNASDTIAVTVNINDRNEKPLTPAAPTVNAKAGTTDQLEVSWSKPGLNGGPDITGYKLQYRTGSEPWSEATPMGTGLTHTLGSLAEDTAYEVQVRAQNGETPSDWSMSGTATTGAAPNNAPEFDDGASTSRSVAENTTSGTDFDSAVSATDADTSDTLTYSLEGSDAASFGINTGTGQLKTSAALDHETKSSYSVRVKVVDGNGGSDTIDVTINVTDANEQPATPAAPTVNAKANTIDELEVSWTKPGLNGGPDITGYKLRFRVAGMGNWSDRTPSGTDRMFTIDNLTTNTRYAVQVLARNGEADSEWSLSGFATTGSTNNAPEFDDGTSTTRSVAENTTSGTDFGGAVSATDADSGDTLTYSLEGADATSFGINSGTGQLRTSVALDHETKSSYSVTVKVVDGNSGSDTIAVTINVTDRNEQPARPLAPTVTATRNATDSLDVSWIKPGLNGGPDITGYRLQFRVRGTGSWSPRTPSGTDTRYTIGNLAMDTEYAVQVRALNGETDSDWSLSGFATTGAAADPAVLTMHALANSVAVGEVARFEARRTGGDGGWLRFSRRVEEADGSVTTTWGAFGPGQTAKDFGAPAHAAGRMTVRVMAPSDVRCSPPGHNTPRRCTDDYVVGSPSSASITVTAAASAVPSDAFVSGALLTLRYAEPLDPGSTPGPKDWVVRAESAAGARTVPVVGVAVSGPEAVLELAAPATPMEAVSVSYLPWPMHPLRHGDGVEAAPLAELAVRNDTPLRLPEREHEGNGGLEPEAVALTGDLGKDAPDGALGLVLRAAAPDRFDLAAHLRWLLQDRPASSVVRLDLPERGLVEVSALAGLTGLEVLDLSGNAVADVWPLAEQLSLRRLDLSDNRITDLSALAGLARLEVLLLDGNAVADLAPLSQLPRLAHLGLSRNGIGDVTLLADLPALERLDLSGNAVSDAAPLGDLGRLVWLDLTGNPLADAVPLGRLTRLRWLWLEPDADGVWALARGASRVDAPLRIEPPAAAAAARQ